VGGWESKYDVVGLPAKIFSMGSLSRVVYVGKEEWRAWKSIENLFFL